MMNNINVILGMVNVMLGVLLSCEIIPLNLNWFVKLFHIKETKSNGKTVSLNCGECLILFGLIIVLKSIFNDYDIVWYVIPICCWIVVVIYDIWLKHDRSSYL